MILLHSLNLSNFLSHEDTEIYFKENCKLSVEGRSGAGKSSLFDAIVWCLYGECRKSSNISLIKSGSKTATVSLVLKDNDKFYKITRKIFASGNKHTLSLDESEDGGEEFLPSPVAGIKNIQEYIKNNILHASFLLFVNSVVSPQDQTQDFISQSASDKKQLLLEIAGSEKYDMYYNRAKERVSLEREAISRITGKLEDKQRFIPLLSSLPPEIEVLNKSVMEKSILLSMKESEQKELSNKVTIIDGIKKRLNDLEPQKNQISLNLSSVTREISRLQESIETYKKLDPAVFKPKVDELEALRHEIEALEASESLVRVYDGQMSQIMSRKPPETNYELEIASLKERIEALDSMEGTKCLQCGAPIPSMEATLKSQKEVLVAMVEARVTAQLATNTARDEYVKKIEALGMRPESKEEEIKVKKALLPALQVIERQYQEALNAQTIILELQKSLDEQNNKLAEFTKNLAELEIKIQEIKMELASHGDVGMLEEKMRGIQTDILLSKSAIEQEKKSIAEKEAMLKLATEAKSEVETLEVELKSKNEDLTALEMVKDAFGSKGIKTLIIDAFVPMLEKRINSVLEQLSEFRVEINTQRESADGESSVEGLYINIISPNGVTREFNLYSGGEKLKVRVAIGEALASLNRVSFRLYDEAFFALDEESLTGFATVLEQIQSKFSQILVISHLQSIKDMFSEKIEVVNRGGDSEIV